MKQASELASGTVIGRRYSVELRIGRGGSGAVYLCSDLQEGGRAVALKVLRADRLDPAREKSLRREYATLSRLRHPHVEAVYDFGRDDSHGVFIAKEYINGKDLLRSTAEMQPLEILALSMQLFRALAFLHNRGLIHNDIKPDNVLVMSDELDERGLRSVLIDFGIVAEEKLQDEAPRAKPKAVTGTLGYLAPERLRGEPSDVRSELYAAGMSLYRLLARQFPFSMKLKPKEVMMFHLFKAPTSLTELDSRIPRPVDVLVQKLLAKRPEDRYQSAREVLADIGHILGEDVPLETEATQEGYVGSVPMIGRDAEAEKLRTFLTKCVSGGRKSLDPAVALVTGPPGVGKSRLVHEVLVQARLADARVVTGFGRRRGAALGALREPLRQLLTSGEVETALSVLDDPELRGGLGREKMLEAVGRILLARGEQVVLAIEDLQYVDDLTLDLVVYLARRLRAQRSARFALLLTCQDSDDDRPTRFLEGYRSETLGPEVPVEPLTVEATGDFVAAAVGREPAPSFVATLHERTGGIPEGVQEGLKLLMATGVLSGSAPTDPEGWELCGDALPGGVLSILTARLAMLSSEARELLRVLALLERPAPVGVLAHATSTSPTRTQSLLGDLLRRDLVVARVVDSELYYLPSHERLATAVLDQVVEKVDLHRRILAALETLPRAKVDAWVMDLAHHAIAARDSLRAGAHALQAGQVLEDSFAWDRALELYEGLVGLEELDAESRVEAELRLARVREQTGDFEGVTQHLSRAIRAGRASGMHGSRARALLHASRLAQRRGQAPKARRLAERANRIFEKLGDEGGIASAMAARGELLSQEHEFEEALELVRESRRLHESRGDAAAEARSALSEGIVLWRHGEWPEAAEAFQVAWDRGQLVPALDNLGFIRFLQGDYVAAAEAFLKGRAAAEERGDRLEQGRLLKNLGRLRLYTGDLKEAESGLSEAVDLLVRLDDRAEASIAYCLRARLETEFGDYERARETLEAARDLLGAEPPMGLVSQVWRTRARLAILEGDIEGAWEWAAKARGVNERIGLTHEMGYDLLNLAEIALERGYREDFESDVGAARESFERVGAVAGLCQVDLLVARGRRLWSTPDEAWDLLLKTAADIEGRGLRLLAARAWEEVGDFSLVLGREPAEVLPQTEAASKVAREAGASPLELGLRLIRDEMLRVVTGSSRAGGRDRGWVAQTETSPTLRVRHRSILFGARRAALKGKAADVVGALETHLAWLRERGLARLSVEGDLVLAEVARSLGQTDRADQATRRAWTVAQTAQFHGYQ